MNLHEAMLADLDSVFFNLDEFACVHEVDGRQIRCIVDDQSRLMDGATDSGLTNLTGLGLAKCDRVLRCQAADLIPQPVPGQELVMDGERWLVADGEVVECEGILTIPLNRAF